MMSQGKRSLPNINKDVSPFIPPFACGGSDSWIESAPPTFYSHTMQINTEMTHSSSQLIYDNHSLQHPIKVYETDKLRLLRSDEHFTQSALLLSRPEQLVLPYMKSMMAALLFIPNPNKIQLLGLGGGDLLRYLNHYLPKTQLNAVENDPAMQKVAQDYFFLPSNDHIQIKIDDAETYMAHQKSKTDWLLIDLFSHQKIPSLLSKPSFYSNCYELLNNNGLLVLNFISEDSELFKEILWILRCQFKQATLCMTVTHHTNILIFAFRQKPNDINRKALQIRAKELTPHFELDFSGFVDNLFATNPCSDDKLFF